MFLGQIEHSCLLLRWFIIFHLCISIISLSETSETNGNSWTCSHPTKSLTQWMEKKKSLYWFRNTTSNNKCWRLEVGCLFFLVKRPCLLPISCYLARASLWLWLFSVWPHGPGEARAACCWQELCRVKGELLLGQGWLQSWGRAQWGCTAFLECWQCKQNFTFWWFIHAVAPSAWLKC